MYTIVEETHDVDAITPTLSSKAAEVIIQVEQAALTTRTSKDRLDLVTKLTDYVSDAIAEGSLTDGDLQRIFLVTKQIGEELPESVALPETVSNPVTVIQQQAIKSSRHATSDLLAWADDVAAIEANLTDAAVSMGSSSIIHDSSTDLLDGLHNIAETSLKLPLTSEQRAANALLNAARHSRNQGRHSATQSRYMDGVELTQVILRHAELDKSSSTGAEAGTQSRTGVKQQRNASGIKQRALSQVAPSTSVYQRLYQLSETWRAHKAQLKEIQEEKDSRAASPTPPARLTSQARQRAADRLYAHAVQKRVRQEAAKQAQDQDAASSRTPSPSSHTFRRHAPDFFQRQRDLLMRRQMLAEQRRPRDEESLQHCTGRPAISAFAHSLRRSTDDLLAWQARKDEKMQRLRDEQSEQMDAELTLTPRIDRNSRQMALSLASRAAEHNPDMLAVIQSQPQGWVLADRPATARRPAKPDSIIANKQSRSAPAWVYANGGTSMRLVQTGRTPVSSSHAGSSCGVHSPHASSHADFDAAFQQAPWMGHGGVRNMEAGHTEAACKAFKPDPAAVVRHTPRLQMPERVSTGGTASLQSASIANAAAYTGFGIGQHSLVSHRLDDTHMTINDEAQSSQHNAEVDSVDPIEAFAPAFVLEHGSQIPAPGLAVQPDGVQPATTALCASDCISKATVEMGGQKNATAVQDKERQGPAEGTWTGFAVDDSIAEGAGGAESSNDSLSNHHDSSTLSVQNNSSSGQDSLKCQDSSAVSSSAAALHSGTQLAHQNTDGITLGDAYYVPLSHQALPASSVASQPSNDPTSAGEVLHSRASDAYLTGISVGVPISRHTSQDRQAIVSRRPAQQSGITSARKALQAIALKAAAEAAYKVDSSNASPSGLQQPQSAMRRTASSSSRQSDGLWTPQSASTSQADQTGSIVSMHSVMKHKPRPLVPRTKLNPKAYNAAMQQIPEMDLQFVSAASHGYARRESLRRRSSGEVSDQSVKIADGKSANLIKVAIDGHTNNAGQRGQSRNK